jgi:nitrogen fixation protein FixH
MKTVLILGIIIAVAAVAAAGYISFSGMLTANTGAQGTLVTDTNAQETVQAAISKMAGISEYDVTYNVTNIIEVSPESLTTEGTLRAIRSGTGSRLSAMMQAPEGQVGDLALDIYILPDGTFSCSTTFGGVACERLNGTLPIPDPVAQAALLDEFSAQGFVTMQSQGSRTAMRPCNVVRFDYNIAKLIENASLSADVESGLKEMSASMCFDSETGIPLEYETFVRIEDADTSMTSSTSMVVTALELTAPEIALPENATIY